MDTRLLTCASLLLLATHLNASEVPMAPDSGKAANFMAIARHLDLGGEVYSYVDIEGKIEALALENNDILADFAKMSPSPQSAILGALKLDPILRPTGIYGLAGVGLSSYRDGDAYINKSYIYIPEGPQGLFQVLGAQARPFDGLKHAPVDADVFASFDLNLKQGVDVVREIIVSIMGNAGSNLLDNALNQPAGNNPETDMTVGELLDQIDTRIAIVVVLGESKPIQSGNQQTFLVPEPDIIILAENMAPLMHRMINENLGENDLQEQFGDFELIIAGTGGDDAFGRPMTPSIAFNQTTGLTAFAFSPAFLKQCLSLETSLADKADFKQAMDGLPTAGNQMLYVSPKAIQAWADFREQMITSVPQAKMLFAFYGPFLPLLNVMPQSVGITTVTTYEDDGILTISRWPHMHVTGTALQAQQNTVTVGLIAAMAIPAFNKVRENAREKAITNNLRQIAAAAQQHILETGENSVSYEQLEGVYFNGIIPVNGEDYTGIVITSDDNEISVIDASGNVITYNF